MRIWAAPAIAVLLGACSGSGGGSPEGPHALGADAAIACIDRDRDGHGDGCAEGADCDDHDPEMQSGCRRCALPNDGCACAAGTQPVSCYLDKSTDEDGNVMCHEGTRYCRDGLWSGCEGIHSYPLPGAERVNVAHRSATPGRSAATTATSPAIRITDTLDPVDGGLADSAEASAGRRAAASRSASCPTPACPTPAWRRR